jgi:hypothetical protein
MMNYKECGRSGRDLMNVLSCHLHGGTEDNDEKPLVRTAGLRAKILTRDLPNTNQEC